MNLWTKIETKESTKSSITVYMEDININSTVNIKGEGCDIEFRYSELSRKDKEKHESEEELAKIQLCKKDNDEKEIKETEKEKNKSDAIQEIKEEIEQIKKESESRETKRIENETKETEKVETEKVETKKVNKTQIENLEQKENSTDTIRLKAAIPELEAVFSKSNSFKEDIQKFADWIEVKKVDVLEEIIQIIISDKKSTWTTIDKKLREKGMSCASIRTKINKKIKQCKVNKSTISFMKEITGSNHNEIDIKTEGIRLRKIPEISEISRIIATSATFDEDAEKIADWLGIEERWKEFFINSLKAATEVEKVNWKEIAILLNSKGYKVGEYEKIYGSKKINERLKHKKISMNSTAFIRALVKGEKNKTTNFSINDKQSIEKRVEEILSSMGIEEYALKESDTEEEKQNNRNLILTFCKAAVCSNLEETNIETIFRKSQIKTTSCIKAEMLVADFINKFMKVNDIENKMHVLEFFTDLQRKVIN